MPKDGRETQWRNLCESDTPELQPLPDKMDDVYTPMQRLCVVRAVRGDRLVHAANIFINKVLGKKSVSVLNLFFFDITMLTINYKWYQKNSNFSTCSNSD